MPTRKCCCGCLIREDHFNRPDSTNVGASWVESSGDWDINSNRLRCETPAGVIRNTGINPYSKSQVVRAKIYSYLDGARYRILANVNSAGTDYYYAEWHYVDSSNMYFRLGSSSAGVIKELGPELPITEGTVCEISVTEGGQLCMQDNSSRMTVCVAPKTGVYTGLAAGSDVVCVFDDYEFYAHKSDDDVCPACDCSCDGVCIPDVLTATYENIDQCPELDAYSVELENLGPIKFGSDWNQLVAENCPYSINEPLRLKMRCNSGGDISVSSLQLEFLQGSATPSTRTADPTVSTCDPLSLRFGPFSYGNVSGGGFPTTCCGGSPSSEEESLFYIWVTE